MNYKARLKLFLLIHLALMNKALAADFNTLDSSLASLEKSQITKIETLDLSKMCQDFEKVTLVVADQYIPIGSCGKRMGALNINVNKPTVVLPKNHPLLQETKSVAFETLLLHEKMGATGYFDENYGTSVGLKWLEKKSDGEKKIIIQSGLFKKVLDPNQAQAPCSRPGGGSTGIGGGGDPLAIQIKLDLLDFIWKPNPSISLGKRLKLIESALLLPLEAEEVDVRNIDPTHLKNYADLILKNPVTIKLNKNGKIEAAYYPLIDLFKHSELRELVVLKLFNIIAYHSVKNDP